MWEGFVGGECLDSSKLLLLFFFFSKSEVLRQKLHTSFVQRRYMHTQFVTHGEDLQHELWPELPVPTGVPRGWRQRPWGSAAPFPVAKSRTLLVLSASPGESKGPWEEPGLHGGQPQRSPGCADAVLACICSPGARILPDLQHAARAESHW